MTSPLKVPVTCVEEFSDVTTNGSRDEFERVDDVTHPSWCNACEDSKDEVECKKLTMVLTTVLPASMEGVGDTKDSREQSIPCADVEEVDDGEVVISLRSRTSFFPLTSLLAQCEKRQQGRARGCVEGFDDGAYCHAKLLPCSDTPPYDNKEMLKVILSVVFTLKTKKVAYSALLKMP
ncbi:uncharacterized protein G2W53_023914 [Senna tora]|uniref:Uncharacterized protein n=1 Tax=Senna tora TaxID=362788 RepID=A0A834TJ58_9FABA|nr:uncharacterized protein G2W53_023914 [Senna tora]